MGTRVEARRLRPCSGHWSASQTRAQPFLACSVVLPLGGIRILIVLTSVGLGPGRKWWERVQGTEVVGAGAG